MRSRSNPVSSDAGSDDFIAPITVGEYLARKLPNATLAVIENVARTIPVDHRLYVKEHGVCWGRRPLGYHRTIKQIPNVRLITPNADTHDLIRKSSATCVINSTVGWEAILYEKPVVTLGDVSYNSFDLVQRVRSFEDLPRALNRAIYHHVPDSELLLTYLAANLKGTYDADINYNPGFLTNPTVEPGNIRRLADAVASELGLAAPPTETFESRVQAPVDAA